MLPVKTLRVFVGLFFIILGVCGWFTDVSEGIFDLGNVNITVERIFGVVEVVCGVIVMLGIYSFRSQAIHNASLVILILWVIRILLSNFIWGDFGGPTAQAWLADLLDLSAELLIGAALWVVSRVYD